jgi:hypothetical protein
MGIFAYESKFVRAGLDFLEDYLLSNSLFWDLRLISSTDEPPYPTLTVGCLLLSMARIQALGLSLSQQAEAIQLQTTLEHFRSRWHVAWKRKAGWEFHSRLNQWHNFLNDVSHNPGEFAVDYAYTVRLRVMLTLLHRDDLDLEPTDLEILSTLDGLVNTRFSAGNFCWEPELARGFPKEDYWYLWGKLVE